MRHSDSDMNIDLSAAGNRRRYGPFKRSLPLHGKQMRNAETKSRCWSACRLSVEEKGREGHVLRGGPGTCDSSSWEIRAACFLKHSHRHTRTNHFQKRMHHRCMP